MRGLLTKDMRLLLRQKQFLFTIVFIGGILAIYSREVAFTIGYCTMVAQMFVISSISYDEYNNGFAFLFTLPVSRRGYVIEKYLFGLLLGGAAWLTVTVLCVLVEWAENPQLSVGTYFGSAAVVWLLMWLMLGVMLPLQLKFGAEKSRIVSGLFGVGIASGLVFMSNLVKTTQNIETIAWLTGMGTGKLVAVGVAGIAVFMLLSVLISIKIVEKKQF